ncbi:MAG: heme-binding domain-containing protein [Chitinophagaceae bacterium]|jgi:hypothetical protein|nr:heme-binding domain-containing protein [Chitinophagaceae bacterium]
MSTTNQPTARPAKRVWLRRILVILLLIAAGIQFIQPGKNNQSMDMTHDIATVVTVPDSVKTILKTACYDCHSNFTQYPWYSSIQPIGWWLKDHIDEGKSHLNFQEFALVKANDRFKTVALRQDHKLEEVAETVESGEMPMNSYTWVHSEAKLSAAQKTTLINWVAAARKELAAADSTAP